MDALKIIRPQVRGIVLCLWPFRANPDAEAKMNTNIMVLDSLYIFEHSGSLVVQGTSTRPRNYVRICRCRYTT